MDKENAKKMLFALASPEEKQEMSVLELSNLNKNYQKFDKSFNAFEQSLNRLSMNVNSNAKSSQIDATVNALMRNLDVMRQSMEALKIDQAKQIEVMAKAMTSIVSEMKDEMVGSIGRVRSVLENQNAGPLYKTMINALAGVKDSIDKKPTPVWNWPQYASVSVRDKSFSNIDPSLAYQHNTTTPTVPYGTPLAFDNGGTINVVSNTNKLPVNASVTIASTSLSGLQVNLSKATTSVLAGLKTFVENFPASQVVNITSATTSVLSGLQVNLTKISTPILAGLKVNNNQLVGIAYDVNTGNASAGTQRVVLASNQPNVPVNISAATTSVLAGLKVDIERSISLPVTIASTSISGLKVDLVRATTGALAGLKVDNSKWTAGTSVLSGLNFIFNGQNKQVVITNAVAGLGVNLIRATTSALSGIQVVLNGSNKTIPVSLSGNQAVNIVAATTSVLAGLKVMSENTAIPFVSTTTVGISASASGDNTIVGAQGVGKQIYVYAWNLSFSGTVNAKFTDAISSKLLCGLIYGVANSGGGNSVSPYFLTNKPQPDLFHTSANSRLLLNLSGGTAVGGSCSFFVL